MNLRNLCRTTLSTALLALCASGAWSATTLGSPGSLITGLLDGAPENLLGLDTGFESVTGANITALTDTDMEFLSSDAGLGVDLFSNGLIRLYDNSGSGWLGSHVLTLSFAGLSSALSSVVFSDLSYLLSGSISATVLSANTVQLTFTDVQLSGAFATLDAQVTAVPEPSTAALLAAGALTLAWRRRSRHA
jgi:hypothetical protein